MSTSPADRGQSNTLAVAIVLVLAITSALAIAGLGSISLDRGQRFAETQSGLLIMTELDSRASLVALEGGDESAIEFNKRDLNGQVAVDDSGTFRLVMRNTTSNETIWQENTSLGSITYRNGEQRIAYQGGGVWRKRTGNGSVMVSPPEVHYEQGTLTLPMIRLGGADRRMSRARMRKTSERRIYPRPDEGPNRSNPVPVGNQLDLYVTSEYYQGWATFFERRIGGEVEVYHANNTVRVTLVSPASRFELASGLISTGTGSAVDMQGNAENPTFLDSYDSSRGPYEDTNGSNGSVRSDGGVELGGNSFILGTVDTGGTVKLSGNDNLIDGDAYHRGLKITGKNNRITGVEAPNGSGVNVAPITGVVTNRVNAICRDGASFSPEEELNGSGVSSYCHEGDFTLNGDTLTVNLSDGNVSLAIDGDLRLKNEAEIEIVNPQVGTQLTIWLGGDSIRITSSNVTVPDQKSPALHLYGKGRLSVEMTSQSTFDGLLFAPAEPGGGAKLSLQSNSELFGAAVVGEVDMQSGSAVHYDQALAGFSFDRPGTPVSRLSYLYVTINSVEVEDE